MTKMLLGVATAMALGFAPAGAAAPAIDANRPLIPVVPVSVTNWPAKPQPVVLELLSAPAPITEAGGFISGAVDVRGYGLAGVHVLYGFDGYYLNCATTEWRWSEDENFAQSFDPRDGSDPVVSGEVVPGYGAIVPGSRTIFHSRGPQMRVRIPAGCASDGWSVRSIRVYLFNEN